MDQDLLDRIEKQRLELETSVVKLRKALSHWNTLELDYEGLKDEFMGLSENATKQQCLDTAHEFEPQKVDEKEIVELIEPSRGKIRRPAQIVEVLTKRVGYVVRNIASLKTQITDLEKKRNAVLLARHPEHEEESNLPVAEITEELDEEGNVLSSKVLPQGETASKVLDVLERTGVEPQEAIPEELTVLPEQRIEELSDDYEEDIDEATSSKTEQQRSSSNSFSTSSNLPMNPHDTEEEARLRQEMLQYGLGEVGDIVAELEMAEGDENFDDGQQIYDTSDFDEEDADYNSDEEDEDEESEDETGQTKRSLHSDKYKRQMEELEKQLGLKMENVGPSSNLPAEIQAHIEQIPISKVDEYVEKLPPGLRKQMEKPPAKEAARKAAIAREEASRSVIKDATALPNTNPNKKSKKKVAFAPELDIAPNNVKLSPATPRNVTTSQIVTERNIASSTRIAPTTNAASKPGQISRFKAARSAQPQTPLLPPPMDYQSVSASRTSQVNESRGPPDRILAETLVERPASNVASDAPPPDPDDFDDELQKRQIALEHHRLRNRAIHEQGGYVRGGEQENWGDEIAAPEVYDEKTGEPRKISRFKAARMRP